jgi:hypothetical protein
MHVCPTVLHTQLLRSSMQLQQHERVLSLTRRTKYASLLRWLACRRCSRSSAPPPPSSFLLPRRASPLCQRAYVYLPHEHACYHVLSPSPTTACICHPGWSGPSCTTPVCDPGCVNGVCTQPNACVCSPSWIGPVCSEYDSQLASLGRWVDSRANEVFLSVAVVGLMLAAVFGGVCNLWLRRPKLGLGIAHLATSASGSMSMSLPGAGLNGAYKKRVQFCPVADTIPPSPMLRYAYRDEDEDEDWMEDTLEESGHRLDGTDEDDVSQSHDDDRSRSTDDYDHDVHHYADDRRSFSVDGSDVDDSYMPIRTGGTGCGGFEGVNPDGHAAIAKAHRH